MYFNVSSANFKENKRVLQIPGTLYLDCRTIELSDSRATVGLAIGSRIIYGDKEREIGWVRNKQYLIQHQKYLSQEYQQEAHGPYRSLTCLHRLLVRKAHICISKAPCILNKNEKCHRKTALKSLNAIAINVLYIDTLKIMHIHYKDAYGHALA